MSGNPPSIVLLPSSSSTSPNPSVPPVATQQIVRPPIILHQQSSNSSPIPFKSVIVKSYRESIQQALTPTNNVDVKPIVLQQVQLFIVVFSHMSSDCFQSDNVEPHQANKRLALDSTDLNQGNFTLSAVPKAEVMTALQPTLSSNSASFSTVRFVTPSTFINSNEMSTCK